ncbi:LolA family protein [Micavibrio aeruginosavorus]|uniref:Outer membrane lipocarrier LolA family protein n=1 Tax=Micavibrio aeruginosavorus (strain ARL-13) TaxID=856793 RepID=G2KP15_MICAA|nr:outer membrane lipoprotein carrier protein LolA [Micavibrio aeruginosavorus]AEP08523.1 outer membrane lipocarrier LolA family protein [Micavibrio aeruginosavorus ARL-13]
MKTRILTALTGVALLGAVAFIGTGAIAQTADQTASPIAMPATAIAAPQAVPALAPGVITYSPEQATAVATQAEQWLQQLKTARARFLLTAGNGTQLIGTFYLNRPGKLRFDYDDPVKDFVVADGVFIYFYDANLGEQSNAPIGQTLADFLLRSDIRLSGDVKVDSVVESGGLIQIKLSQTADAGAGSLTLGFTREPFQLKKWRVVDPQGSVSEVELFQMQTGVALERDLFVYRDPQKKAGSLNQ